MTTTPTEKINIFIYFGNLFVGVPVLYIHNMHIKFHINQILFTIRSINLFLCIILDYKNLKFKHLIDDIAIDLYSFENFANMKHIRRKCNPTANYALFKIHI